MSAVQPHPYVPMPDSVRCAFLGCSSPRMAMIHRMPAVYNGPVPSFPSAPVSGSPEAVAQAAETIRPCGPCGGRGYVPDEEAGSRACRDCNRDGYLPTFPDEPAPDLLAEVERLRAQVENLHERLKDCRDSESYWKVAAEKALTDLDRQHALAAEGSKQRDELADALEQVARLGGNLPDDRLTDPTGPNDAAHRGLMYTEARRISRAALQKTGR